MSETQNIISMQTPVNAVLESRTSSEPKTAGATSSVMTRSMAKGKRPLIAENSTPLTSMPAMPKAEKRKRTTTVTKKQEETPAKKCCFICEEEQTLIKFYPCQHQTCCFDCSLRLKKCPRCKKNISRKERANGQQIDITNPISYEELLKKVRELEENQLCTICMSNRKAIVFNCGHMACHSCMSLLTNCHYCREEIKTRTKMYEV